MVFYRIRCKDSPFLQNYEASSKETTCKKLMFPENLYREGIYDTSPWANWTCMNNSNEFSAKWPHGVDIIKISQLCTGRFGSERHWRNRCGWKAVMGGTSKGISSLKRIFSTCPEKPIRDIVIVTHNKICMLSLNYLGFKREELWTIIRLACSSAEDERRLLWKRSGGWKGYM